MLELPKAPSPHSAAGHATEGPGLHSPSLPQTISMRTRVYVDGCLHPMHLCSCSRSQGRGASHLETPGATYSPGHISHANTAQGFSAQTCISHTLQHLQPEPGSSKHRECGVSKSIQACGMKQGRETHWP